MKFILKIFNLFPQNQNVKINARALAIVVVVVVGLRPTVRMWDLGLRVECPLWGLSKGSVFLRISEKTTENSEKLGRQTRLGMDPAPSI